MKYVENRWMLGFSAVTRQVMSTTSSASDPEYFYFIGSESLPSTCNILTL